MQPHWYFVGQDVDLRCVQMTAINLALRNSYGHVVYGNTLTLETNMIYETGRVEVYGNAIRKTNRIPMLEGEPLSIDVSPPKETKDEQDQTNDDRSAPNPGEKKQLHLF